MKTRETIASYYYSGVWQKKNIRKLKDMNEHSPLISLLTQTFVYNLGEEKNV